MNNYFKKAIAFFSTLLILSATIVPSTVAFANSSDYEISFTQEELQIIDNGLTDDSIAKIEGMLNGVTIPSYRIEDRSVQTQAVKKAIKAVIKKRNAIVNLVGKYVGRDAAVSVGASLDTVMPVLRDLQYWSDLAYGTVEGQVKNALVDSGMANSTASTIAYWIRLALEWVL